MSRPVVRRAIRIAFSIASAPPFVKKTFAKPSPARSTMRFAASPRARFAVDGATVASSAAWRWMASTTRGCECPMLVLTSWHEKSSHLVPS